MSYEINATERFGDDRKLCEFCLREFEGEGDVCSDCREDLGI